MGPRSWRLPLLLVLGLVGATLPFHLAGRLVQATLEQGVAGFAAAAPWSLVIDRYTVGLYRSGFSATLGLDAGVGPPLQLPVTGEVEHGLLATRIVLQGAGDADADDRAGGGQRSGVR